MDNFKAGDEVIIVDYDTEHKGIMNLPSINGKHGKLLCRRESPYKKLLDDVEAEYGPCWVVDIEGAEHPNGGTFSICESYMKKPGSELEVVQWKDCVWSPHSTNEA